MGKKKRCQTPRQASEKKTFPTVPSEPKQASKKKATGPIRPRPPTYGRCIVEFPQLLQNLANERRMRINCGPELEERNLIWRGTSPFTWTEKSSGVSWIGVSGKGSYSVVSMNDGESLCPRLVGDVLTIALPDMSVGVCTTVFGQYMLSHKPLSHNVVEPYAVVSVAPGFVVEENGYEGRPLAVRYLEKQLELNPSCTSNETRQIAICALKHLLGPKFKSDRIQIRGLGNGDGMVPLGGLGIMDKNEVDQHLAHWTPLENK